MDTKKKGKKVENKRCFLAEAIVKVFPEMTYYEKDFKKNSVYKSLISLIPMGNGQNQKRSMGHTLYDRNKILPHSCE